MITSLRIMGFKRFIDKRFTIKNLTILTGVNGSGKSSFIQGMLLLNEVSKHKTTIPLDIPFGVDLGTARDVINWNCVDDTIKISLETDNCTNFECELKSSTDTALYLDIVSKTDNLSEIFPDNMTRSFSYLCAERFGPKAEYKLSSKHIDDVAIGIHGENCAQLIESIGNTLISDSDRIHPDTPVDEAKFVVYQLERWMSKIVRPLKIRCTKIGASSSANLQFKVDNDEWVKASNMGFGVTYVLPIILAGLIMPRGGLLIVENPEAHLHPSGQSAIGEFIAWLSSKGIQVVMETHSDHVLNGIRIAIGTGNSITNEDSNILFFDKNDSIDDFIELQFNKNGGISKWPKSFFDQYQIDTATLGKMRRGVH